MTTNKKSPEKSSLFSSKEVTALCKAALAEDVLTGDATTLAIVPENVIIHAFLTTREDCVCCGMPLVEKLYHMLDKYLQIDVLAKEGEFCPAGTRLATIHGDARSILTGERIALNFLQHLSGVATITRKYVEALGDSKTKLLDTRKTLPGYRRLEKYAVACGGGTNHRMGLYDMIMIKDNHRELARMNSKEDFASDIKLLGERSTRLFNEMKELENKKSIENAVKACRNKYPNLRVEVEADTLEDVKQAVKAGADVVMFDNMSNDMMRKALKITGDKCQTEASGGITLERLPSMANLGLTFISVGALTHSVKAIDIGLDM